MKIARFVLKIVATCLAVAAAVCCVHGVGRALGLKCCQYPSEYDDYADWDE